MKVVLILWLMWPGSHYSKKELYFETIEQCMEVLKETKIVVGSGAENEWGGAATCGYKRKKDK